MATTLSRKIAAKKQHAAADVTFVVLPVARKTVPTAVARRMVAEFKARNPGTKMLGLQHSIAWKPSARRLTGAMRKASPDAEEASVRRKAPILPAGASALAASQLLDETTRFLRNAEGMLDAAAVAELFTLKLAELARLLGISRQAFSTTTASPNYQPKLETLERVARLLAAIGGDRERFKQWLRTPNRAYQNRSPLQLIALGQAQFLADHVEGYLAGQLT